MYHTHTLLEAKTLSRLFQKERLALFFDYFNMIDLTIKFTLKRISHELLIFLDTGHPPPRRISIHIGIQKEDPQ